MVEGQPYPTPLVPWNVMHMLWSAFLELLSYTICIAHVNYTVVPIDSQFETCCCMFLRYHKLVQMADIDLE